MPPTEGRVIANDLEFAFLEEGSGPLALCLHGFPDSAWTYRYLLPALYPSSLTRRVQILLGAGVLAANLIAYALVVLRSTRDS